MGDVSRLSVSFDGKDIKHDVTSVQIALWNRGKKSIRTESILKPIFIYTNDGTPLLEAKIIDITRDIIGVSLDTNHISRGKVGLSWKILENSDGLSLQLIYGGPLSTQFKIDGVIEGQKTITKYEKDIGIKSEQEQYRSTVRGSLFNLIGGLAFIATGVFLLFKLIRSVFDEFVKSTRKLSLLKMLPGFLFGFFLAFFFGYAGIISLIRWFQKGPPFNF